MMVRESSDDGEERRREKREKGEQIRMRGEGEERNLIRQGYKRIFRKKLWNGSRELFFIELGFTNLVFGYLDIFPKEKKYEET